MLKYTFLFILFAFGNSTPASAQADRDRVLKLLDLVEFTDSLADVQSGVIDMVRNGQIEAGSDYALRWEAAAQSHFDQTVILDATVEQLGMAVTNAELDALIAIYSTEFAIRISKLELQVQLETKTEQRLAEGAEIAKSLGQSNPARLESYMRMLDIIGAVDAGVSTIMNMQHSFLTGASASGLTDIPLSQEQILAFIGAQTEEIRALVSDHVIATTAFTYRSLSDRDMVAYVDLLSTPDVVRFYTLLNRISGEIMADEFGRFAVAIGEQPAQQEL